MPNGNDWLPGRRELQLAMARRWHDIIQMKATAWNIPPGEVTALDDLTSTAAACLQVAQSTDRTAVTTAQCKEAFDALVAKMRFLKSHYFLTPPLTKEDYVSLELKPHDTTPTPVPTPTAQAEADISRPGVHLLELHLHPIVGSPTDPNQSDYGFRIYYGVLPPGGASVEAATGAKRELLHAPTAGEDLPHSKFTRRKKERFDFAAEDSGKTAYFAVKYENAKGESGPWGPMFSAVIP
jgi:hypothetical protein